MKVRIGFIIIYMIMRFAPWLLLCLGITGLAFIFCEKKMFCWILRIVTSLTLCIILWVLVDDIIKYELWYGIWLLLCVSVTVITAAVQLINKKIRKKKPIHWAIKLAGYAAFYTISYFASMNLFGSYPGNWLATDKEYRELAYELYHLEQDCYGYEGIHKGSHGEIVFSFEEITYHSVLHYCRTVRSI